MPAPVAAARTVPILTGMDEVASPGGRAVGAGASARVDESTGRSQRGSRRVFIGLVLVSIALLGLVIWPLAQGLFLAAVLASVLQGLHGRLTRLLRGRSNLAAGIICASVV